MMRTQLPGIFFVIMSLLLLASCATDMTTNQRWNNKTPELSLPKDLATPGSRAQVDLIAQGQGQGPYAEGGLARQDAQNNDIPPVKVAILLPLSGASQEIGQSLLKAAQLALFDLGADSFQLLPKDTGGTSTGASLAAQEAIQEGAELILGPLFSHSVQAVKPIATRANINVIAFSTDWTKAGDHVYLTGFMPFAQVRRTIGYAARQGLKNIVLVTKGDAYGQAIEKTLVSAASMNGVQISKVIRIGTAGLLQDDLQDMRLVRPDAVFLAMGGQDAMKAARRLQDAGMTSLMVKRLGTGLWDDEILAADPYMDGGWFAAPAPRLRTAFEKNYKDLYGVQPPRLATLAYDATALAAVLGKMGKRGDDGIYRPAYTAKDIRNQSGFAGIDGVFRFNEQGLIERQLSVLEFRNGTIVEIDPARSRF
ncbi:MAG: penicillin-binding protein activator [Rhodospirillales bacterium]|nr:penicillin-binding protein activator [Rhodospirillales bacterium]